VERVERLTGIHPVREALRARRRTLHRLWIRPGARRPELAEVERLAREGEVPAVALTAAGRRREPGDAVALDVGPLPEASLADLADAGWLVALDGVEDPRNLGAVCRVADAAGVGGLLIGRHRAAPLSPAVSRASAGALEHARVHRAGNLARAINQLKSKGFWVLAADPEAEVSLFEAPGRWLDGRLVLLLGGEGRGLGRLIGACADHRLRIPMAGRVESLNVSTAAAVLLFEIARRRLAQ
jgi:23S rRNA (guanosine2251-2'-O)-methyltransferase